MKLVMDEKLKHRLIGLAVIISLGAIFAPAVMKKSSQNMENNLSVNVKLPAKPLPPDVVMTDEKELFRTIKVAKVDIAPVSGESQLQELAKAEPIKSDLIASEQAIAVAHEDAVVKAAPVQIALNQAAKTTAKRVIAVAAAKPRKSAPVVASKQKPVLKAAKTIAKAQIKPAVRPAAVKKDIYAVQLASFSQISNAQALVTRLRGKGYKANYTKAPSRQGSVYKVYVGHSPSRTDVVRLKTQLASAMQLDGFVVNTGVS